MKMKKFFSEIEIKNIENALKEAEKGSDGEIVPIFAKSSAGYDSSRYIFALLLTIISTIIVIDFFDSKFLIALSLILSFSIGINITRICPSLCLPFINRSEIKDEVNRRACEYFYSYNLGNTKKGSALLIYISYYEHMAMVKTDLRDGKILANHDLQEICDLVTKGISENKAAEGLISAINKCGELLKKHFPNNSENNPNELPNKIYFID